MDSDNGIEVTEIPGGRIVKPTGSIFRLSEKTISQMSDVELKGHIIELKTRLQARKQEVDALTIQLSQSQHEVSARDEKYRIKLKNIKVGVHPKVKTSASTQKEAFNQIVENLKKNGMSAADIAAVLTRLMQGGK